LPHAPSPQQAQRLQVAGALLRQGRAVDAAAQLRALLGEAPELAQGHQMLGVALARTGDSAAAEDAFRAALAIDPLFAAAADGLAELMIMTGRSDEAVALLQPLTGPGVSDLTLLSTLGLALRRLERVDEAIAAYERAAAVAPASAVAQHNLAGALGDAQRFAESETASRAAFSKGLDAPETWLVHARALQGQGRLDEAETAYREVIRRRPDYVDAHGELAQLIWMRTEDPQAARQAIDAAIAARPASPQLREKRAKLLEYMGDLPAAYDTLAEALSVIGENAARHALAAQVAAFFDPALALNHAERAFAMAPEDGTVLSALSQAALAAGQPERGAQAAQSLLDLKPLDQYAQALLATAWRLTGDARYSELYDYERMVGGWRLDTPAGWPSLEAYLADLAQSLETLHPFRTHPVGQSVRHGSQTPQDLTRVDAPAVKAFFEAIDGPIRRHIAWLGDGADPLRRRSTGGYRFNGVWSIRLRPGGFHADHVHTMGWLSSACYIALPRAVESGREGWLKFGEPGVSTSPALAAEHFVKPEPGLLALFPSYMWHGTVPFGGDEPRLTVAFDLVPA
jgi:tetratricopeptide (TPR) repeat protein